mmetsp:Transcript_54892/g.161378  ORF Transcript_54892/g.161378 Transcript_54892/m.161378 type:complete len:213 (+) Transcript_54892:2365-3003(+)
MSRSNSDSCCWMPSIWDDVAPAAAAPRIGASPPKLTSEVIWPTGEPMGDWLATPKPSDARLSSSATRSASSSTTSRCSATASSFCCIAAAPPGGSGGRLPRPPAAEPASETAETLDISPKGGASADSSRAKSRPPSTSRSRAAMSATCCEIAPTLASTSVEDRIESESSLPLRSRLSCRCCTCCAIELWADSLLAVCCFKRLTFSTSSHSVL